jgi:hypothetical protein
MRHPIYDHDLDEGTRFMNQMNRRYQATQHERMPVPEFFSVDPSGEEEFDTPAIRRLNSLRTKSKHQPVRNPKDQLLEQLHTVLAALNKLEVGQRAQQTQSRTSEWVGIQRPSEPVRRSNLRAQTPAQTRRDAERYLGAGRPTRGKEPREILEKEGEGDTLLEDYYVSEAENFGKQMRLKKHPHSRWYRPDEVYEPEPEDDEDYEPSESETEICDNCGCEECECEDDDYDDLEDLQELFDSLTKISQKSKSTRGVRNIPIRPSVQIPINEEEGFPDEEYEDEQDNDGDIFLDPSSGTRLRASHKAPKHEAARWVRRTPAPSVPKRRVVRRS